MFKVSYEVYDPYLACISPTIIINYDGYEFSISKFDDDLYAVYCVRGGEWANYADVLYHTIAEACEAIFYGTIIVNRTECAYPVPDWRGEIVGWEPLSYYDLAA